MRHVVFALLLVSGLAFAQASDEELQRAFVEAVQQLQAGNLGQAEAIFRKMLEATGSPRVRLELARVLYLQGKYQESKVLFQQVANLSETPWRVRDNVTHFVREIENRTGYLKFGVTVVSDNNPRNLAEQKEFSIGDLRVTPTEAPEKVTGLRYSVRGWLPFDSIKAAGYLTASYVDYPSMDLDRLTVDGGVVKNLTESGRLRIKPGIEFGTFGGKSLYQFAYVGLDAVLAESESYRLTGEMKTGKVYFPDFEYLEANNTSAAVSVRKVITQSVTGSLSGSVEHSSANEDPYSYYGWDVGPAIDTFWPGSTYLIGARATVGARKYADTDPLFGKQRSDSRARLEASVGNKRWRWRDSYLSLVASLERSESNIEFFSYRKSSISVVVE